MSDFRKCEICNEFGWFERPEGRLFGNHKCSPIYEVNHEDYMGDDWEEFRASSYEDAAEKYGRKYNEDGDYALMDEEIIVNVRKQGEEEIVIVSVSAEPDIHYSTDIVEEGDSE